MDREMQRALEADGKKLRQLTGQDHGPAFITDIADMPARSMTNRELDEETERLNRIWPRDGAREQEIEEEKVRRG